MNWIMVESSILKKQAREETNGKSNDKELTVDSTNLLQETTTYQRTISQEKNFKKYCKQIQAFFAT